MKKLFFALFMIAFATLTLQAQDGKKALNEAKRALSAFNLDNSNKAKLQEAKDAIDLAAQASEIQGLADLWNTKGNVYNEIATQIVTIRQLGIGNVEELPKVEGNPALIASEAYRKAMEVALKKPEKKDALQGMQSAQNNLNNLGFNDYEAGKYAEAYAAFTEVIATHDILKNNGEESALKSEDDFNNQLYIAGLSALNAQKSAEALSFFEKLYQIQFDKPAIYEALYEIKSKETSPEQAYTYLEAGRNRYPDEISLLFADINHYLRINKLDVLIGKLQMAIEKEPDNVSLYTTTGSVYDNLYQREFEAGNIAKADEYFNKSLEYFNLALAKDANYFDAIYSAGALYYNKAATMTKDLQKLADDYSKEGLKKYEAKREEIFKQFDQALPYFKRCEKIDPNDTNTLIALKEIFARRDDLETSNEFKKRLETVQGGGKNEKPYFND